MQTSNLYGVVHSDEARLRLQAEAVAERTVGLLERHGLDDGMRVLDLGCGLGLITQAITQAFPRSTVIGVDVDERAIAQARLAPHSERASFAVADALDLPFERESFDFVAISLVLMHLRSPARALAEARRVLAPGGRLVVLDTDDALFLFDPPTPAFESLKSLLGSWYATLGGSRETGRRLPRLLAAAGFDSVGFEIEVLDSLALGPEAFASIFLAIFRVQMPRMIEAGLVTSLQAVAWLDELDATARAGYFATIAGVCVSGRRPPNALQEAP